MNNNANCETVYIHGVHGVTTDTYPTVSVGEAYPLLPVPYPGKSCTLSLYTVDNFNNEVDPFNLVINCDNGGSIIMEMTALDVVNHNPIFNDCLEVHHISFGRIEVNIDDVIIVDDLNNVLGKLNEKIYLNSIPFSIKLRSKEGGVMRLKTHVIKL